MDEAERRMPDADRLLAEAPWIRRLAASVVGEALADDVVQETYVAAIVRRPGPRASLRSWLAAVAKNFARRKLRDERTRERHERAAARPEAVPPLDEVERVRLHRLLTDAVLDLPEPYRTAVVLRYLEELAPAEIARRLAVTPEAARQRVHRGLVRLRTRLDREFGEERDSWVPVLAAIAATRGGAPAGAVPAAIAGVALVAAAVTAVLLLLDGAPTDARPATAEARGAASHRVSARTPDPGPATASAVPPLRSAPEPEVAAAPARELVTGRVTDPGARPLVGARVELWHPPFRGEPIPSRHLLASIRPRDERIREATTGKDGTFALAAPPGRLLDVVVRAPGFATCRVASRLAGEHVEIVLRRRAALEGSVVREPDGTPVAGATIEGLTDDDWNLPVFETTTDAAGTFRVDDLDPERLLMMVVPAGDGTVDSARVELVEDHVTRADFRVPAGHRVTGAVLDAETGAPVADALVARGWRRDKRARTGPDGRFEIRGLQRGDALIVSARGYGSRALPLDPSTDSDLTIRLSPGRRARGVVIDPAGAPVRGAILAATAEMSEGAQRISDRRAAVTGEDGAFVLEGLRADLEYGLYVRREGLGAVSVTLPAAGRRELDLGVLVLDSGTILAGEVTDEHGDPIAGGAVDLALLELDASPGSSRAFHEAARRGPTFSSRRTRCDPGGRFRIADVAAGTYSVTVRVPDAEACCRERVRVEPGEARRDLRLVIDYGRSISGIALDERRRPLEGIYVTLVGDGDPRLRDHRTTRTGADGSFRFVGLASPRHHLHARSFGPPLRQAVHRRALTPGDPPLELVLRDAVRTTGEVLRADGTPVAGAWIAAIDEQGAILDRTTTRADGTFRLVTEAGSPIRIGIADPAGDESLFEAPPEAFRRVARTIAGEPTTVTVP